MSKRKFLQYLSEYECKFVRNGGGEDVWCNKEKKQTSIPRKREIKRCLVKTICKQLKIPPPL